MLNSTPVAKATQLFNLKKRYLLPFDIKLYSKIGRANRNPFQWKLHTYMLNKKINYWSIFAILNNFPRSDY